MDKKTYLPLVKTDYTQPKEALISYAPDGSSTPLANTVTDDIVVNNISCMEFDNTDDLSVDDKIAFNP